MPFVPRSHGSLHLKQHRRQSQPYANTGAAAAGGVVQMSSPLVPRDVSQQLDTPPALSAFDQADQLHLGDHHYVFAMGMFVAVLIAYLSRRHIRSSFSRIVHAISSGPLWHGTASHLVHIHFHTTTTHSYSPLHDADHEPDTVTSPIERSTIDIEASRQPQAYPLARDRHLLREEEPAPPYSTTNTHVPSSTSSTRSGPAVDKRNTKSLHIKVPPPPSRHGNVQGSSTTTTTTTTASCPPPRSSSLTPLSSTSSGYRSPSDASDSGSSCGQLSPVGTPIERESNARAATVGVDLASPRVTRWDAFPPPPPITSGTSSTNGRNGNGGFYRPALPSDILGTHSPSATPPPQYTITIHSSGGQSVYNNSGYQQGGEVGIVPDIVLSPVPWLPRESVPKSPPHYLTVPPRKSRSRPSTREKRDKALPSTPSQDEKSWATKMHEKDVGSSDKVKKSAGMVEKKRHYFTSQVSLMALPTLTHSSIADNLFEIDSPVSMSSPTVRGGGAVSPTTFPRVATSPSPSSSGSGVKTSVQRASTLPIPNNSTTTIRPRMAARPPPPRPILPDDLEAVYPDTPSETEDDSSSTSSSSSSSSTSSGWRESGVSEKNGDGYGTISTARFRTGSDERVPQYASTMVAAAAYSEKRAWTMVDEKKGRQDTDEEEDEDDDVPLAQGLLRAVRKKKEQMRRFSLNTNVTASAGGDKAKSPVIASKVFKEKLFGRLSALAARAKEALENELDSDDEEKRAGVERYQMDARRRAEEYERRREALLQREREAANAFVIGEED